MKRCPICGETARYCMEMGKERLRAAIKAENPRKIVEATVCIFGNDKVLQEKMLREFQKIRRKLEKKQLKAILDRKKKKR